MCRIYYGTITSQYVCGITTMLCGVIQNGTVTNQYVCITITSSPVVV